MPRPLVYLLYNLLLPVALLLGLPSFLIKGWRRGGLARHFRQRLGFYNRETLDGLAGSNPIWIHAVSVGEVFIALKIVDALQARAPDRALVLSTTTTTGFRVAAERADDTLTVIHNPVDLPIVVAEAIRQIRPSQLVLVESEIWPNLVGLLKRRDVPVKLVNARLSPRSERRYRRFLPLVRPVFSLLDGVAAPFEPDRERWAALGIERERIRVLGSVKFDHATGDDRSAALAGELARWLADTGMPEERRILLAGSTHDGEERLLAEVAERLREDVPELELVIVPRHAERGPAIAAQLRELGLDPVLRSRAGETEAARGRRVWIADTTGELRSWFQLAEIVVIGKSFRSEGGQNPVEAILAGKPVVVGPNMQNFAEVVADLEAARGILRAKDDEALESSLRTLLTDPVNRVDMARRGAEAMARHEGAADRTAEFILETAPT